MKFLDLEIKKQNQVKRISELLDLEVTRVKLGQEISHNAMT